MTHLPEQGPGSTLLGPSKLAWPLWGRAEGLSPQGKPGTTCMPTTALSCPLQLSNGHWGCALLSIVGEEPMSNFPAPASRTHSVDDTSSMYILWKRESSAVINLRYSKPQSPTLPKQEALSISLWPPQQSLPSVPSASDTQETGFCLHSESHAS